MQNSKKNGKDGKKKRGGRKKTPHSWGVISQAKIRHKGKETFDKNQDGSPKNPKRTKLSKKLTKECDYILKFKVDKCSKYKPIYRD